MNRAEYLAELARIPAESVKALEMMAALRAKDAIIRDQAERLDVYETALEQERQWRLRSLPALLAAEAKAARCVCQRADVQAAPEMAANLDASEAAWS